MMKDLHWRAARPDDLASIVAIAARVHPALPERAEVLADKLRLFPAGCAVLVADDTPAGYGLAHPWMRQHIPLLDHLLGAIPAEADCLYIHDVAILPEWRGRGALHRYLASVVHLARSAGIGSLALVSVYGTQAMWARAGFHTVEADATLAAKLASYGESATYMVCDVTALALRTA